MKNKYTLDDLAWLSRGLFPHDFRKELQAIGIDKLTAYDIASTTRKPNGDTRNILAVYQECISCPEYIEAIDLYCKRWLNKTIPKDH